MSKIPPREGRRDDAQGQLDPAEEDEAAHGGTERPLAAVMEVGFRTAINPFMDGPATPAADPGRCVVAELDLLAHAKAAVVSNEGALDADAAERIAQVRGRRQELGFAAEIALQAHLAVAKYLVLEMDGPK